MTEIPKTIRNFAYRHFTEFATAPSRRRIAERLNLTPDQVRAQTKIASGESFSFEQC